MIGRPAKHVSGRCFSCRENARARAVGVYRGESFITCLRCVLRFDDPVKQAERFGRRFRFVERGEIPHQDTLGINESLGFAPYHAFTQIYKILLLLKERQEIRQKEVNWMVEEKTEQIIKLADRVATIVGKTFAVLGDDTEISDDQALVRIRDLLEVIDPEIIHRNKNKRLP